MQPSELQAFNTDITETIRHMDHHAEVLKEKEVVLQRAYSCIVAALETVAADLTAIKSARHSLSNLSVPAEKVDDDRSTDHLS